MSRPIRRPPSRRRMQVEAWAVVVTLFVVGWCLVGGVWMGVSMLAALARAALSR